MLLITENVKNYIVQFLLGEENKNLCQYVYYEQPEMDSLKKGIYIVPSDFFEKNKYMQIGSIPKSTIPFGDSMALFGKDKVIKNAQTVIVYADIIASAFFCISRYEEYINRGSRDEHGRFKGRESVLYKLGLLQEPIVDYYGKALKKYFQDIGFNAKLQSPRLSLICMTHDIDDPWLVDKSIGRYIRNLTRDILAIIINRNRKLHLERLKCSLGFIKDPYDTFDFFVKEDDLLRQCYGERFDCIYFLMVCKQKNSYDRGYMAEEKRTKRVH